MTATIIIILALAAMAIYAVVSYRKRLKSGCCGSGDDAKLTKVAAHDPHTGHYSYHVTLDIVGMHCANCAQRIENAFNQREGTLARVHLGKRQADVYAKSPIDEGTLRQIVAQAGYHVTAIH